MKNKSDTRTMLLTASPLKLMISLSLPAIIGMVVVGLYNLMDGIYVGLLLTELSNLKKLKDKSQLQSIS